ncbi:MAG TPA: fructosamine kinase family protein, partial [Flavisolibacter sp.]
MDPIRQRLSELFPSKDGSYLYSPVGGGSINETARILWGGSEFFCKINSATKFPHLFLKEKNGLERIAQQGLIKTPAVIDHFESGDQQFLLLEWITTGARTNEFWKLFGEQLAALHHIHADNFGWEEDNYMGSVEQGNKFTGQWE